MLALCVNEPSLAWAGAGSTAATAGSGTTCYDNGGTEGGRQEYSLGQNDGAGANCALSFLFQ